MMKHIDKTDMSPVTIVWHRSTRARAIKSCGFPGHALGFDVERMAQPHQPREGEASPSSLETLGGELIVAMREEMLCAGEMLALMNEQRKWAKPDSDDTIRKMELAVDAQLQKMQAAQKEREARQKLVRMVLLLPKNVTFSEVIPRLPAKYQAVTVILAQETLRLKKCVLMQLEQKHLLLRQMFESSRTRLRLFSLHHCAN